MLELFKVMWIGWGAFARGIIKVQNAVLMGVAYIVGIGPVSLYFRLVGRSMLDRGPADSRAASFWVKRSGKAMTMEEAGRQF